MQYSTEQKAQFIAGLHALADWLATTPDDFPLPYDLTISIYGHSIEEVRELRKNTGPWNKTYHESYIHYEHVVSEPLTQYGQGQVSFQLNVLREEVCTKVQTGTKLVPAQEAYEVPVYEWYCGSEDDE